MRKEVRGANPSGWNFLKAVPLAGRHDPDVTLQGEAGGAESASSRHQCCSDAAA
jgi:hypothetical protein